MLQIRSTQRVEQIEHGLRIAAARHGGSVLTVDNLGCTLCFNDLYTPLLRADPRFGAFLPSRIAVCAQHDGVLLEALSPREYCRLLHRPELEPAAVPLEAAILQIMEEAARVRPHELEGEHRATEEMVDMRAALPQRIDCRGTKVEELAGTGVHDAQGG
jgi:hypothetical protein